MLKNNIPLFISLFLILSSCDSYSPDHLGFSKLEQIKYEGSIDVLTRQDPTTYYEGAEGLTGLEYDLVMLFAKRLKVKVNFIIPTTFDKLLTIIAADKADIAAAGLTITDQRLQNMRFAPSYQSITEQIIYRSGRKKPRKVSDLVNGILEIVKGTSHLDALIQQQKKHPKLTWNINTELNTDGLMYLVNEGLIDYTIADSHQARSIKRFYPKLNIAFDITEPRQLAWAFPLSKDDSLYNEAKLFFQQIQENKTLEHLLDKYYGNSGNLSYVGNCQFRKHVESRLPFYKPFFKAEALKHDIDWRLLAAIGYQESHWRADVTSPTGVKGLMMLTKRTARQLGIKDRTDPIQSIIGGALYFKLRLESIPAHIQEPDRTWYALASYNVGFGHLKDAMFLTRLRKGDPNKWLDVKESLPLLTQKKWYKKTVYGYARGKEPVGYVENIRSYYALLVWLTEEDQIEKNVMSLPPENPENQSLSVDQENEALSFEPSIL
ncbi:MAG: membrane-bound lytic murein transglycosylase MltF [Methylococcales bacterium]|nr:membrane-bound lytic murein transglycosylase MltF [Methylococcales bacterium]